jgi:hypothetical protein
VVAVTVTDDVEIEQKGGTMVKLKPRKYSKFSRQASRPGVYGASFSAAFPLPV